MANKETKRLSVADLMKEKEKYQVKDDVTESVIVERLNAEVVIRKPEKSLCVDTMKMARDENNDTDADEYMVYNTVVEPNLKDKELQKEFGCKLPTDIVAKIFEPGEIAQLSEVAFELAGYKKGGVKAIKN
ncbi:MULTISPECIES: phage tail assembly chaperone [unclassified Lysinibacillus]|uniref:phage tail assembly chaperone n=1 Tax=unclassified Lysinibacillus TaxID=2636778 RepID=UPI0030F99924